MKKQITILFMAAILLVGLVSMGLFMRRETDHSLNGLAENSRSQLDLMGDLLLSDLDHLKSQLARTASLMEAGQSDEAQKQLQSFIGVAALDPVDGALLWKVQRKSTPKEGLAKDEWSSASVKKLVAHPPTESDVKFVAIQSAEGIIRSALSVMAKVRDRKSGEISAVNIVGLMDRPLFQDLVDKLKSQGVHVFLTTTGGLTLAHSVSEYVGNSMTGDSTYESIRKSKSTFGSISSSDIRGDSVLSFFIKLPVGQLTLVSQWRKSVWLATDWAFYGQLGFLLVALTLLFGWVAHRLLLKIKEGEIVEVPVEKVVERVVEKIIEKPVLASEGGRSMALHRRDESKDRDENRPTSNPPSSLLMKTLKTDSGITPTIPVKVLSRVIDALRAPLLSVLGQVQIARINPQGGALQVIETEVRNAQDTIDRLGFYCGQSQVPSITVPLYEIVEAALRLVEGGLLRGHIKVLREIPADLAIRCDIDDLKSALAALLRNSIEAMEKSFRKTLTVRALRQNQNIVFEIEDTGEGVLPENMDRIYEPFFTTRSTLDHKGLGLSYASGVLRQHQFQFQVVSSLGEGTRVKIEMPLSQDVVHSLNERGISTRKIRELSTPSLDLLAASEEGKTLEEFQQELEALSKGALGSSQRESSEGDHFADHRETLEGESIQRAATLSPKLQETKFEETRLEAAVADKVPSSVQFLKEDSLDDFSGNPLSSSENPALWTADLSFIDSDDEEGEGEFQFGRLDFADPLAPPQNREQANSESRRSVLHPSADQRASALHGLSSRESSMPQTLVSATSSMNSSTSSTSSISSTSSTLALDAKSSSSLNTQTVPSSSLSKRLKKKEEPLASMKVQIPRPEERL